MLGIGLIGCGHWGPNYLRLISTSRAARLVGAVDINQARREHVAENYQGILVSDDPDAVIRHPDIHAVIIATPAFTHYDLARRALDAGKDVLCEKPLALSSVECDDLAKRAEQLKRILMVGHIYLFNSGIRFVENHLQQGAIGRVFYAYSIRSNNGPVRTDCSAVYDLASHDIAIFRHLFGKQPIVEHVSGLAANPGGKHDAAFVSLRYDDTLVANVHVSWIGLTKTRQFTLVGSKETVEWDELSDVGPVRLVKRSRTTEPSYQDFGEFQLVSREKQIEIPSVEPSEPLRVQLEYFLRCVKERTKPLSDGEFGADIVRTLEDAERLMVNSSPKIH